MYTLRLKWVAERLNLSLDGPKARLSVGDIVRRVGSTRLWKIAMVVDYGNGRYGYRGWRSRDTGGFFDHEKPIRLGAVELADQSASRIAGPI